MKKFLLMLVVFLSLGTDKFININEVFMITKVTDFYDWGIGYCSYIYVKGNLCKGSIVPIKSILTVREIMNVVENSEK